MGTIGPHTQDGSLSPYYLWVTNLIIPDLLKDYAYFFLFFVKKLRNNSSVADMPTIIKLLSY